MPGTEHDVYGVRVPSFAKDKSSYKYFLGVTAKEKPRWFNSCRPVRLV